MTDETKINPSMVDEKGRVRLLREPPDAAYVDYGGTIVEWHNGEHTHLLLEVMTVGGGWQALAAVSLQDCRASGVRNGLRQFPMFRLAWIGQVGEQSRTPQLLVPVQEAQTSAAPKLLP